MQARMTFEVRTTQGTRKRSATYACSSASGRPSVMGASDPRVGGVLRILTQLDAGKRSHDQQAQQRLVPVGRDRVNVAEVRGELIVLRVTYSLGPSRGREKVA